MSQRIHERAEDEIETGRIAARVHRHPNEQRNALYGATIVVHGILWAPIQVHPRLPTLPATGDSIDFYAIRKPEHLGIVYGRPFSSEDGYGLDLVAFREITADPSGGDTASLELFRQLVLGNTNTEILDPLRPATSAMKKYRNGEQSNSRLSLAGDFTDALIRIGRFAELQSKEGVLDIMSLLRKTLLFPVKTGTA